MKTAKPILPATPSDSTPTSGEGRFSSRRAKSTANGPLTMFKRLRFLDGLSPGSRFSWLEVSNG